MKNFSITILIFLATLLAVPCFAIDVYINPDYGGGDSDGTFAKPWASWTDFTVTAGNDYRQLCGTTWSAGSGYPAITAQGTSGDHIIIGAYYDSGGVVHEDDNPIMGTVCGNAAAKPIITNTTKNSGHVLSTRDDGASQYLEFNSISVRKGSKAINIVASDYNFVRYCYIFDAFEGVFIGSDADLSQYNIIEYTVIDLNHQGADENADTNNPVTFNQAAYNIVRYCHMSDYDHGGVSFSIRTACQYNEFYGNYVYGAGNSTEDVCIMFNPRSSHNIAHSNRCENAGVVIELNGSSYNEIYNNIGTGEPPADVTAMVTLQPRTATYAVGCTNNYIVGNIFYDFDTRSTNVGVLIYALPADTHPVEDNYFANNIFQKTGSSAHCIHVGDDGGVVNTNYYYNNICYEYGDQYARIEGVNYANAAAFNAWNATPDQTSGNIESDPAMNDPDNDDFTPTVEHSSYEMGESFDDCLKAAFTWNPTNIDIGTKTDYGENIGAMCFEQKIYGVLPIDGDTGVATSVTPIWSVPALCDTLNGYFKAGAGTPDTLVFSGGLETSYDPPGDLAVLTEYGLKVDCVIDGTPVTGDEYHFTTTEGPPPTPPSAGIGGVVQSVNAPDVVQSDNAPDWIRP